jgi:hypothetical protein
MNATSTPNADDPFAPPEFVPAHQLNLRAVLQDRNGDYWAFIDEWSHWLAVPLARVVTHGDTVEIAIRPFSLNAAVPEPRSDEVVIVTKRHAPVALPPEWTRRQGLYAVKLPGRPQSVRLVDR